MSNPYYTATGTPGTSAQGASAAIRSEYSAIQTAFDKFPTLAGKANLPVTVNPSETGLTTMTYADFRTAAGLGTADTPTFAGIAIGSGGSGGGSAITATTICKRVSAIADAVSTAVLALTVPNSAQSASCKITLVASLGAGGSVGANEGNRVSSFDFVISRVAGVSCVAVASSSYGVATSNVAGGDTPTVLVSVATSGGSTVTQTVTVSVTITKSGGASNNHSCLVKAELMNANASGVTI